MTPLIETRKVILFDLDGTILDNMDLMYTSLRDTMAAFGYPGLTEETHATLIGMGEKQAMAKLGIPQEEIDGIISYRREIYRKLANRIHFFEGMNELMTSLEKAGCTLGIVTGSNKDTVNLSPAAREAVSMVEVVVTADDTTMQKPDPAPIRHALNQLGTDGSQAVYIGDGPHDIESARRAGCISFLATWNHLGVDLHFAYQPHYTVKTVGEFRQILLGDN